jgi:hypothetical protein
MNIEEKYRLTKINVSYQDLPPAQKNKLRLKIYAIAFLVTFILFFFAVFAALIALGLIIVSSLVLGFRRIFRQRGG